MSTTPLQLVPYIHNSQKPSIIQNNARLTMWDINGDDGCRTGKHVPACSTTARVGVSNHCHKVAPKLCNTSDYWIWR